MRPLALTLACSILALGTACSRARRSEPAEAGTSSGGGVEVGQLLDDQQPVVEAAFDDAAELETGAEGSGASYGKVVSGLLRKEISGTQPGAFVDTFRRASDPEKDRLRRAAAEALAAPDMTGWIDEDPDRQHAALWVSTTLTPPDAAAAENVKVEARLASFSGWERYPYQVIVVPGYTPLDAREAAPGVHPIARARLEEAVRARREGMAPFILVSGGNVYPPGTPYYEGVEMKRALVAMGVPEDGIIVEARARHSTTNLRNAGRFMLARGMKRALVTPPGGGVGGSRVFDQTFYFSNPEISTFHGRCERELGFRVGELEEAGPGRVAFTPSKDVQRFNYRDPLDP
jgi:hypothetical protein